MFRNKYVDYAELNAQLRQWATRHPDIVRVSSIGASAGGRDIPLLTIGREPDRERPAVWIDANMHAVEFCGTSVALAIAEDILALHGAADGADGTVGGRPFPAHLAQAIRETLFYIVPRISPDGAEALLKTGRYVRSHTTDDRVARSHPYWEGGDIDGDGFAGVMRQRDPDGELAELRDEDGHPLDPPVLVPRLPEDPGPYYRLYPEGRIVNFDGRTIPSPHYLSDSANDFNRNFPYDWQPEPLQAGAGHYPGSTPETRAVIDFATRHPNIMVWLNLHTFGGTLIRPLGDKPDGKMNQDDLALYRQVEAWLGEHTGYASVSGFEEFTYEPDKPLRGDMTAYAYHQRGALAYVIELWDLFAQLGIERRKPFVDHYSRLDRKELRALARFDRERNGGRIFKRWRPYTHPQIGAVELDGFDMRVGISNPPYELLDETCRGQSAAFLRVAALLPRIEVGLAERRPLGAQTQLVVRVVNHGYLSSAGIESARALPVAEPLRLTAAGDGLRLLAPAESVVQLGHLDGWGQGLYGASASIFFPWTRGNGHERFVTLVVEGRGTLRVTVGSSRVGWQHLDVEVGVA